MKKILYGFIALSAIFAGLTSCDDTNIDFPGDVDQNVGPVNIVVSSKSDDTRIYFQHANNVLKSFWEDGDKVLAISQSGTVYELQVSDIEDNHAHITGMAERGTTVKLVYQKGITKDKWVRDNGLKVDFSNQQINKLDSDDVPGKYQIAPVVMAGDVEIDDQGKGNGELDFLCGIVKVTGVNGLLYNDEDITKISLWGTNIAHGTYSYDKSSHQIVYIADKLDGSDPNVCDEICVNVGKDELGYDANFKLHKEVFFAVPCVATPENESDKVILKQATVTTTKNFYFHNINAVWDENKTRVTSLGQEIKPRDYYYIDNFEAYYYTVLHQHYEHNGNPDPNARKIQLAPGNLYAKGIVWDGNYATESSAADVKFYFEKNQWDYRQIDGAINDYVVIDSRSDTKTPEGTCGSFMWSEYNNDDKHIVNARNAYCKEAITNYAPADYNAEFFTQSNYFWVSDQPEDRNYRWYTLTGYEWDYLVKQRLLPGESNSSLNYTCAFAEIEVGNPKITIKGLIIFHDNYVGKKKGLTYVPDGCAFMPVNGCRTGVTISKEEQNIDGSYWASNLGDAEKSYMFVFFADGPNGTNQFRITESKGRAIRLARDLSEPSHPINDPNID